METKNQQNLQVKNKVEMEIDNFILYYTSDDKEREDMQKVAEDFMNEIYED